MTFEVQRLTNERDYEINNLREEVSIYQSDKAKLTERFHQE